ncbi:MAG: tetratricopeptide repeat protein [Nitrospirae bacterium]|nr:tetratricopeptide repeat protein [Nitrospirota bacterium]
MLDKASIIREVQKHLAKGQIDKAIVEWEKLIKEYPDGNTYNALGDLYLKKGDRKNAINSFYEGAKFFKKEGFSHKALGLYKKILNINPADADSLISLGEISEERGLKTDAIKYYFAAADSLSKEGKKEAIFDIYNKILNISPTNIPFRSKIAEIYIKEGLKSEAAKEFLNIAKIFEEKGDIEKSLEYYKKALETQPSYKDAILGINYILAKTGDLEKALEHIKEASILFPEDSDIHIRCAEIHLQAGMLDKAKDYIEKITEIEPSNIKAIKLSGEIYLREGQKEKAWMKYLPVINEMLLEMENDDAIKLLESFKNIDSIETGKRLITLYRQKGDNPKVANELLSLADVYSSKDMQKEALECYKEVLLIKPDDQSIKSKVVEFEKKLALEEFSSLDEKASDKDLLEVDIFLKYGLIEDAKNLLEEVKKREPENIGLHHRIKSFYINTEDKEQAITECIILSELYEKAGDIEKKKQIIKEAYELSPNDPRLAGIAEVSPTEETITSMPLGAPSIEDYIEEITEADFYIRQGLIDEAKEILERLQKLFPENEEIKQKLASLPQAYESLEEETLLSETVESEAVTEPAFDSDVLSIFNEFKKGIEKELGNENHDTHYNLGLAYKELGFLDDAIKEFKLACDDPKNFISSSSMLSICYMEKGLYPLAINILKKAIGKIDIKDESYWAMKYDLAEAYEKSGNLKEALETYIEINEWNSKFRDVSEKIDQIASILTEKTEKEEPKTKKDRISYI